MFLFCKNRIVLLKFSYNEIVGDKQMNKRKIYGIIACIIALNFVGCTKNVKSVNSSAAQGQLQQEAQKTETKGESSTAALNNKTIDGLSLSVTSKLLEAKGDRTQNNEDDPNGSYIAFEGNIVKASDYNQIVVYIDVKNDTDKPVLVGILNWTAELQDGSRLKAAVTGDEKDDQIKAKTNGKYEFRYIVKKGTKVDKLNLSYLWIKNKEAFSKLLSDPNFSKMSQQEIQEKNKDVFTNIKFQTDIKK